MVCLTALAERSRPREVAGGFGKAGDHFNASLFKATPTATTTTASALNGRKEIRFCFHNLFSVSSVASHAAWSRTISPFVPPCGRPGPEPGAFWLVLVQNNDGKRIE